MRCVTRRRLQPSHPVHAHPPRPPAQTNGAAIKKGFFSRTADATWNTVSAPVRFLTPVKKPATTPAEPETWQAPEAINIVPQAEGGEGLLGVATQPATTLPK